MAPRQGLVKTRATSLFESCSQITCQRVFPRCPRPTIVSQIDLVADDETSSVLVVDDEPSVARTTERLLGRKGYRVTANTRGSPPSRFDRTAGDTRCRSQGSHESDEIRDPIHGRALWGRASLPSVTRGAPCVSRPLQSSFCLRCSWQRQAVAATQAALGRARPATEAPLVRAPAARPAVRRAARRAAGPVVRRPARLAVRPARLAVRPARLAVRPAQLAVRRARLAVRRARLAVRRAARGARLRARQASAAAAALERSTPVRRRPARAAPTRRAPTPRPDSAAPARRAIAATA
jgi:hypothetical protein